MILIRGLRGKGQQIRGAAKTGVRITGLQFVKAVNAGSQRDHWYGDGACRLHVRRRIAYNSDRGMLTQLFAGQDNAMLKDICAGFARKRKRAESKIPPQSCLLQLEPANSLQIS